MNVPFGKGRRQYSSGNLYEGMWVNGKRHGYGVFSWSNGNGEYMGQWVNGVQVCVYLFFIKLLLKILYLEWTWYSYLVYYSS